MRKIGIPNSVKSKSIRNEGIKDYLDLAEENKIPLFYLKSLPAEEKESLGGKIEKYERWHRNALDLSVLTTSTLESEGIEHAFFKTFKPFPYTPADVDVLLEDEDDLDPAMERFEMDGFQLLERSSYGSTLYNPRFDLNLDLTTRIDVSGLVYLGKKHVLEETNEKRIRGTEIRTPKPYADMTIAAAHALYKEQLFTLSDYYTLVMWGEHLEDAMEFAEKGRIKPAMLWALNLASEVTKSAFGHDNEILKTIDKLLEDEDEGKEWKADEGTFKMPYSCPLPLLAKALARKVSEDPIARGSMSEFFRNFADPRTISEMMKHFDRESY